MSQPDTAEALAAARQQIEDLTKILMREGGVEGAYERRLAEALRERDEARAERDRFKDIARQRSEDYLAANAERVKAVEEANNPSMEVPCGHCGTKFIADEFTCGDCMDEVDEKCFAENMRELALEQREACAAQARSYAYLRVDADTMQEKVRATPLVTEGEP